MKTRKRSILLQRLWPLAALLLATAAAHATEALITEDSTIFSGSAASTYGVSATQLVNSTTTKCAVLRFEVTSMLPVGVTADNIATATLRVFSTLAPTGTGTVDVHTVLASKSWTEANATGVWVAGTDYTTTPVLTGVSVSNFALYEYTALDVTSAVKGRITTPSTNNGFIIRPGGTIGLTFATKENTVGGHNAVLDITLKGDVGYTTAGNNTVYGQDAFRSNTTGAYNIAVGDQSLYSNTPGGQNTGVGRGALYTNSTGEANVAVGLAALQFNTTALGNTAVGYGSLASNTTGEFNVAVGFYALYANTTASENAAFGKFSLDYNTTGTKNLACGTRALNLNTTGNNNIGLGYAAGSALTTGSDNIDIANDGVAGESGKIRIGVQGTQTATYVAGISGATAASGVAVYVNTSGQLGTLTSSRKFKRDIADMDLSSEAILSLRPVNFHYKAEIDSEKIPQYGLIAEEVAEIAPDLVARDAKGEIYTVRYEAVNAMLLNEFQKEHKRVEAQAQTIARQQEQIQKLTESMEALNRRLPAALDKN